LKFFFDNNLSPHLAHAIGELCKGDEECAEVVHLVDRFDRNAKDTLWIPKLASEGGWVVISGDRFAKSDEEREAVRRSGLIIFTLAKTWSSQRHWPKAQNLVKWWPAIADQAGRITGGAAFRVNWRFSGKGRFEVIRFDP
jgi:hypothetical protein